MAWVKVTDVGCGALEQAGYVELTWLFEPEMHRLVGGTGKGGDVSGERKSGVVQSAS